MNRLRHASSPYLQQHADNPVDWWEWGTDALAEAQRTDKPILLSVGYAACHWCHVMAHESFEDGATAALMNALFVNIKVDREERPDIDQIYMDALHALGEQGGWPLTMFCTPKGEPFWGGTYFPKEARFGRADFASVLRSVEQTYRAKPAEIGQNVAALRAAVLRADPSTDATLTRPLLDEWARRLGNAMDPVRGGLNSAPKFPNASLLELLWRAGARLGDSTLTQPVLTTLDQMALGGIHDHLGGGFARYSVDARWLVPHFEKMLYDNAQLLGLYAEAYLATKRPLYRDAASGIVAWLVREMRLADGAFGSSLDADSDGMEGRFYVWTRAEIDAVLPPDDAALFARVYDIQDGGNWHDEHSGLPTSIPNRLADIPTSADEETRLAAIRTCLLDARASRIRPGRDDKVLADWNGLTIVGLVSAGHAFDEPGWIDLGREAFAAIRTRLGRDGRLGHSSREGRVVWPGMASDYGAMALAALALHEVDPSSDALSIAHIWLAALRTHHQLPDGLLATAAGDSADVLLRPASTTDEAVPNAHGTALSALLRLAALADDSEASETADAWFDRLATIVAANPFGHASILNAFDFRLRGASVVIAGRHFDSLHAAALRLPLGDRVVRVAGGLLPATHPAAALAQIAGDGAAMVCADERCSLPVRDAETLTIAFQTMTQAGGTALDDLGGPMAG